MTAREITALADKAIDLRVSHLPNAQAGKKELGKPTMQSLMIPRTYALDHPATDLFLNHYATHGCPVDCGEDWTMDQLLAALRYGAHPSAKDPVARQCLLDETRDKVKQGFARVMKWKDLMHSPPANLKLSPVAMIPHKSRAFRCILDLSFTLKISKAKSVNESTVKQAPPEAMNELGSALKRIIAHLADSQLRQRTLYFSKLDIKDGFWRMIVNALDAWNFCYMIPPATPDTPIEDIDIVIPDCLQMGWAESPPFFCAASETARDVIASLVGNALPPHPFETRMLPANFDTIPSQDSDGTLTSFEVYVDDFIGCTDIISKDHLLNLSRAMLHGIHSIFPPREVTGHAGEDPISEKKLDQLEGLWDPVKEILGWMINGNDYTLYLPPKKVQKILDMLSAVQRKTFIPVKDFQKITGTLHHASMGIPGGRGLFTALWTAYKTETKQHIRLTAELKNIFDDFKWLFKQITKQPVNVAQLVPCLPISHGYTDACKYAAGGAWILQIDQCVHYIMWTVPFPDDISNALDAGTISINDLEMAGVLLGWFTLEYFLPDMRHHQAGIQCDNSSTVHWSRKFTARSPVAGHLLRALALRQQIRQSAPLLVIPIAGEDNTMADVASRFATDTSMHSKCLDLLTYFNTFFPQEISWKQFHLPSKLTSRVMSSLRGKQLTLEWWQRIPKPGKNTGATGLIMQPPCTSTLSSKIPLPSSETLSLPHSLLGSGQVTTAKDVKSKFSQSLMRYRPSARPSNWLDSQAQSTEPTTFIHSLYSDALKE